MKTSELQSHISTLFQKIKYVLRNRKLKKLKATPNTHLIRSQSCSAVLSATKQKILRQVLSCVHTNRDPDGLTDFLIETDLRATILTAYDYFIDEKRFQ